MVEFYYERSFSRIFKRRIHIKRLYRRCKAAIWTRTQAVSFFSVDPAYASSDGGGTATDADIVAGRSIDIATHENRDRLRAGSAQDLPFENNSVCGASSCFSFDKINDSAPYFGTEQAMRELARVFLPGAQFRGNPIRISAVHSMPWLGAIFDIERGPDHVAPGSSGYKKGEWAQYILTKKKDKDIPSGLLEKVIQDSKEWKQKFLNK